MWLTHGNTGSNNHKADNCFYVWWPVEQCLQAKRRYATTRSSQYEHDLTGPASPDSHDQLTQGRHVTHWQQLSIAAGALINIHHKVMTQIHKLWATWRVEAGSLWRVVLSAMGCSVSTRLLSNMFWSHALHGLACVMNVGIKPGTVAQMGISPTINPKLWPG